MAVSVSGKLAVRYLESDGSKVTVEVLANNIEISGPEIHDAERKMGPEFVYTARVNDERLGEIEWQIYEYPTGFLNHIENPRILGSVLQQPKFDIALD